jgi:hypothetical protein
VMLRNGLDATATRFRDETQAAGKPVQSSY